MCRCAIRFISTVQQLDQASPTMPCILLVIIARTLGNWDNGNGTGRQARALRVEGRAGHIPWDTWLHGSHKWLGFCRCCIVINRLKQPQQFTVESKLTRKGVDGIKLEADATVRQLQHNHPDLWQLLYQLLGDLRWRGGRILDDRLPATANTLWLLLNCLCQYCLCESIATQTIGRNN